MHVELYNLRDDPGEAHDLATTEPATAAALRDRLHAWRKEVGAQMPLPNPGYDPARPEYTPPPPVQKKKKKARVKNLSLQEAGKKKAKAVPVQGAVSREQASS